MINRTPNFSTLSQQRQLAFSRWETDGGLVGSWASPEDLILNGVRSQLADVTNAEFEQLRIRVIALENLMIALLADASDGQLELAHDMSAYISPRPGFTLHPMTLHAAVQMKHLVARSGYFRVKAP